MRATPVLLATAALCAVVSADRPSYDHIAPSFRYSKSSWDLLKDVDVKGIVAGSAQAEGLQPFDSHVVPDCSKNETFSYRFNSTVAVNSGQEQVSSSGITATVLLSCLTTTTAPSLTGDSSASAHVYDMQVRDAVLLPNNDKPDSDFSLPFQFTRDVSGSILSVHVDTRESAEVAAVKKSIAENFQSRFKFEPGGAASVYEKGVMATRNSQYSAVTDPATGHLAIHADYSNDNVKQFNGQGNPVHYVATTNALMDNKGVIRESLDRTHAVVTGQDASAAVGTTDDSSIIIHGASDVVFLEALTRTPTGSEHPVAPNSLDRRDADLTAPVAQVIFNGQTVIIPAAAAPALTRRADLVGEQFRSEGLAYGASTLPMHTYDFTAILADIDGSASGAHNGALAARSARAAHPQAVSQLVEHAREVLANPSLSSRAAAAVMSALAATGDADAQHVLADHATSSSSRHAETARHTLTFARAPHAEVAARVAASASIRGNELVLGALLEHQTPALARRYMEPVLARATSEHDRIAALHAVGNMGNKAFVVRREVLKWASEATASLELRAAAMEALGSTLVIRRDASAELASALVRRDAGTLSTDWGAQSHAHDLIEDASERAADMAHYDSRRGFVAGRQIGWTQLGLDVAAGAFAGSKGGRCGGGDQKLLARLRGDVLAFGTRKPAVDVFAAGTRDQVNGLAATAYVKLIGKTIASVSLEQSCALTTVPLVKPISTPVFPISITFPIYVASVDVGIEVSASVGVDLVYTICGPANTSSSAGHVGLRPTVTGTIAGTAGVSVIGLRGGLELAGTASLFMGPEARMGDLIDGHLGRRQLTLEHASKKGKKCHARKPSYIPGASTEADETAPPAYHDDISVTIATVAPEATNESANGDDDSSGVDPVPQYRVPATEAAPEYPAATEAPAAEETAAPAYPGEFKETEAPAPARPGAPKETAAPAPAYPGAPKETEAPAPAYPGAPNETEAPAPAYPGAPEETAAPAPANSHHGKVDPIPSHAPKPVYTHGKVDPIPTHTPKPVYSHGQTDASTSAAPAYTHSSEAPVYTQSEPDATTTSAERPVYTHSKPGATTSARPPVYTHSKPDATTSAKPPVYTHAPPASETVTETPSTSTSMHHSATSATTSAAESTHSSETSVTSSSTKTTEHSATTTATTSSTQQTATPTETYTSLPDTTPTATTTTAQAPPKPTTTHHCQACVALKYGTDGGKIELAGTFSLWQIKTWRKVFWSHEIAGEVEATVKGADVCLALL
ncbi:hypothetical protein HDU87_008446 [Geranomyces variabilis]|uniref:Uncharacterized protein n=1 Tax=Geranomyces variabilis TaxID=109894 RepID=A0AAD5TE00_9FUNG|nr:hypothetical protein HDU87_008446 [Geranomyces variabilis]